LKIWDHVSGVICVTESGGTVTDFAGAPLAFERAATFRPGGMGVVVSNGNFHEDLVQALAASKQQQQQQEPVD